MKRKAVIAWLGIFLGVSLLAGCAKTPEESLVKQKGKASLKNYEEADAAGAGGSAAGEENTGDAGAAGEENADEAGLAGEGSGDSAGDSGAGGDGGGVSADGNEDASGENGAGGENSGTSALRQMLGAPEHYQSETQDETGKLQVLTDADVEIPDADKVSAIAVSQHPFDQDGIDQITEVFFPEAKFYTDGNYNQWTKADCEKQLEELKGYVAEGNLDPYDYGTDENGNNVFDIYGMIESYEQMYQDLPEERTLVEVHPQYGLPEDDGEGGTYTYDDAFLGVACQPDGTVFQYKIKSYSSMPMEVSIQRIRELSSDESWSGWMEYDLLKDNGEAGASDGENIPDEADMPETIGITLEEAKKIADEKVEALQLENMEMTSWEYGLLRESMPRTSEVNLLDTGYMLHYTRKINGIPITYTPDWGGCLEDMDSEMETWGYEVLDIVVTSEGIDTVNYNNRYDIGEIRTEKLSLLPFEKIMEIYEKMMVIQNADILEYSAFEIYHIDRITFGYSRIYEPASDNRSGLLVPVWDFFGSDDSKYGEEEYTNNSSNSYLTINAIDGSIIDRGLGY